MRRWLFGLAALLFPLALLAQEAPPPAASMSAAASAARDDYLAGRYTAALEQALPLAEAGDAAAQNLMGAAYDDALGVSHDPLESQRWYELAAAQGYGPALQNLGQMLRDGRAGVEADPVRARALFEQSVASGWVPAHEALAWMLLNGVGGPHDLPGALAQYEAGRAAGNALASHGLATLFRQGNGVAINLERARALDREAAEGGLSVAMNSYGVMLELGEGGPIDRMGAEYWYRRALDLGEGLGGLNLAYMLSNEAAPPETLAQGWALCRQSLPLVPDHTAREWKEFCNWVALYAVR